MQRTGFSFSTSNWGGMGLKKPTISFLLPLIVKPTLPSAFYFSSSKYLTGIVTLQTPIGTFWNGLSGLDSLSFSSITISNEISSPNSFASFFFYAI